MPTFPIRSARALLEDDDLRARWAARESIGRDARTVLAAILDQFVADGGPIAVETLAHEPAALAAAIAELDGADLVAVRDGRVLLAYPFASAPVGFAVTLADGRERQACCAIDALGIAPMLGVDTHVRARCRHSGEPVDIVVTPTGPVGGDGVMAWVGRRETVREKACEGL
jgi:hypothetical protein